jgi:hypothetical protein|tara:strand:- start:639 stop:914 length:276 start_codon:yes stop_codon:yes gene_type:complete
VLAGQAVVFPPGMIHQTMSIQDENANDGDGDETTCAASITYQWFGPIASTYIKSHMGRLLLSGMIVRTAVALIIDLYTNIPFFQLFVCCHY